MFANEEIKDIPACDASDQLIGFRPNFSGSQPDQLTWSSNVTSGIASTRINQQPTEGGGRWSWQKDSFTHEFNHDWWTDEDRNVESFVSPSGFGASNLPFPDLEEEIKPEDLKEPEPVCTLKSEEPTPEPSSSHSCPEVSSTSNLTAAVPVQTSGVDVGNINLSVVACKIGETNSGQHFVKYLKHQGRTTKIWECGTCGREFQHQYSLMRHLPTHTDERNFHCFQCGKRFRQLSTLSQHRAIHSAARPYSCEVCRKTFNRVSTLISHRKTHSGNKPYKCHVCPKGFYQKGNLRNHLFTHTNERPYICNICNKGFNQQSNLVCHKNKVHVEESNVYLLPCTDNFTAPIQAQPCARRKLQPKTKQTISSTCNGQLSLISDSVQTMEVGSTSLSQDPYQLSVAQWNSMREESSFVPDLTAGVIVDPIKTYHMGVAQATRQTPFALLKLEHGTPVLVKVVDTNLPGGKQMLVTATAEDLRIGGKIIVSNDNQQMQATEGSGPVNGVAAAAMSDIGGALQIRVPVVATVIQRLQPSGKLLLAIEEPHATATSLPANPLLPGQGVDSDQPEAAAAHGAVESCARSRCPVTGYATCEYPIFDHLQDHFVSDSTKNNTGAATAASAANNCAAAAQAPPPPVMAPTTPKPALPLPPLPPPLLASPCRGLESTEDLFVHLEQFPDQSASFCIQLSDSD